MATDKHRAKTDENQGHHLPNPRNAHDHRTRPYCINGRIRASREQRQNSRSSLSHPEKKNHRLRYVIPKSFVHTNVYITEPVLQNNHRYPAKDRRQCRLSLLNSTILNYIARQRNNKCIRIRRVSAARRQSSHLFFVLTITTKIFFTHPKIIQPIIFGCVNKWLHCRFAAQERTERVSRSLKRKPVSASVIAAAKRARRALAQICVT